MQPFLYS
jgi:hypothetical protein